jgi:hypothetical protein
MVIALIWSSVYTHNCWLYLVFQFWLKQALDLAFILDFSLLAWLIQIWLNLTWCSLFEEICCRVLIAFIKECCSIRTQKALNYRWRLISNQTWIMVISLLLWYRLRSEILLFVFVDWKSFSGCTILNTSILIVYSWRCKWSVILCLPVRGNSWGWVTWIVRF